MKKIYRAISIVCAVLLVNFLALSCVPGRDNIQITSSQNTELNPTNNVVAVADRFGASLAISGDTAVVGAPDRNSNIGIGAVYVFTRSGAVWSLQQKLMNSDAAVNELFGWSVAISDDTLVVGARGKNDLTGAVYVFTRSGTVWSLQQKLITSDTGPNDHFPESVAVSGDTIMVGAGVGTYSDWWGITYNAVVYVFNRSGTVWSQTQKITSSDDTPDARVDNFGRSIAISGDTAVVGNSMQNTGTSAVYVFTRSGTVWSQQQKLLSGELEYNYFFGVSVGISDGTIVVCDSANNRETGAAYVFTLSDTVWILQQKLTSSDGVDGDHFGSSIAISGNTAIVGATSKNNGAGGAYVFTRSGANWSQQQELIISDPTPYDLFGSALAISGDTIIVGAQGKNNLTGATYVFTCEGTVWKQLQLLLKTG